MEYHCDEHGFLVATTPERTTVWCHCGKRARILRAGRLLDPDTLKPTKAKARELNTAGQPFIHACGDCREDFGGKTLRDRHRVGRGPKRRCLTPDELASRGFHRDDRGRWHRPAPKAFSSP